MCFLEHKKCESKTRTINNVAPYLVKNNCLHIHLLAACRHNHWVWFSIIAITYTPIRQGLSAMVWKRSQPLPIWALTIFTQPWLFCELPIATSISKGFLLLPFYSFWWYISLLVSTFNCCNFEEILIKSDLLGCTALVALEHWKRFLSFFPSTQMRERVK